MLIQNNVKLTNKVIRIYVLSFGSMIEIEGVRYVKKNKVSVVVPCFNEEDVLPIFIEEIINVFDNKLNNVKLELIFIDDGSKDNTLNTIKKYSIMNEAIKYISFSRNFGKEGAIYAGLKYSSGDYIVIMDSDMQHPPQLIPEMYNQIIDGNYDMVGTFRRNRKGERPIRSFLSHNFYKVINKVSEITIIENSMDFRMLTRRSVNAILELSEYNRFSKGIFSWIGFDTKYLSFDNVERAAGDTKWSLSSLLKYSMEGCFAFSTFPLTISSYLGIGLCGVSLFIIVIMLIQSLLYGIDGSGYVSIICTLLMIGGMQLFCLGIVGQYIAKIYLECKDRPKFIIKDSNVE